MISLNDVKNVHFVGIGGISMSGLAQILLEAGYTVTGSDINDSNIIGKLIKNGAKISIPHDPKNVEASELVVYTAAVKQDNCEIVRAKELKIPIIDRAEFLGIIMKTYAYGIAIAGCHGKTTTTSMVSIILKNAELDPTILIGGEIEAIDGNVRVGKSKYFVTEACEYTESFLKFYPYVAAILNVEKDHLDYFRDLEHIISAFEKFARLIPKEGSLIVCSDNENALNVSKKADCKVLTYGIKNKADFHARNIRYDSLGHPTFDVRFRGKKLGAFSLSIPGEHNILNAMAAIAIAYNAGIHMSIVKKSLQEFKGTYRRFDIKGTRNNITIVDDYAHHPTEIKATLQAAKQFPHQKIWCVFQPHTYTRTRTLFDEFSEAFYDADNVIITDIYAAREKDTGLVNPSDLVDSINKYSANAVYRNDFRSIADMIVKEARPGDLIFTMGAGDVFKLGPMILDGIGL
ncbi:MAG: UDP-N-acetylmuramate--alanine ligase [Clostridia bacterium BRH_c25]|nr:MAG: UDP-N-acetylmuramate--alanine ligase [Clostridia bacterium BRH_c25]